MLRLPEPGSRSDTELARSGALGRLVPERVKVCSPAPNIEALIGSKGSLAEAGGGGSERLGLTSLTGAAGGAPASSAWAKEASALAAEGRQEASEPSSAGASAGSGAGLAFSLDWASEESVEAARSLGLATMTWARVGGSAERSGLSTFWTLVSVASVVTIDSSSRTKRMAIQSAMPCFQHSELASTSPRRKRSPTPAMVSGPTWLSLTATYHSSTGFSATGEREARSCSSWSFCMASVSKTRVAFFSSSPPR